MEGEGGGDILTKKNTYISPPPPPRHQLLSTLPVTTMTASHRRAVTMGSGSNDTIFEPIMTTWYHGVGLGDESDGAAALAHPPWAPSEVGCERTICLPYKRCAMNCCMRNLAV